MHIVPPKTASLPFEIENVGPRIGPEGQPSRLTGTLPPGVLEFLGGMAAGKSHHIWALLAAAGADIPDQFIEVTRGADVGRVRLGPDSLIIKAGEMPESGKRGLAAPAEPVDVSPLSVLFRPDAVDPAVSRKLRITAFLKLARLEPTRERLAKLCAGSAELLEWIVAKVAGDKKISTLDVALKRLTTEAHRLAREDHESKIKAAANDRIRLEGRVEQLLREAAAPYGITWSIEPAEEDDDEQAAARAAAVNQARELLSVEPGKAPADLEAARREFGQLEARREARIAFDALLAEVGETEEVIDTAGAEAEVERRQSAAQATRAAADQANSQRAKADASLQIAAAAVKTARERHAETEAKIDGISEDQAAEELLAQELVRKLAEFRSRIEALEAAQASAYEEESERSIAVATAEDAAKLRQAVAAAAVSDAEAVELASTEAAREAEGARIELARLQKAQASQAERQLILSKKPADVGPEENEVDNAANELDKLAIAHRLFGLRSTFVDTDREYLAAVELERVERQASDALRDVARNAHRRLYKLLTEEGGIQGVEITEEGDILIVDEYEGEERKRDVADLAHVSEGERMSTFLDMAQPYLSGTGIPVIHLEGRYWRDLDETRKRELAAKASRRGQCILTEVPTDEDDTRPCSIETGKLIMVEREPGVWTADQRKLGGGADIEGYFQSRVYYRRLTAPAEESTS